MTEENAVTKLLTSFKTSLEKWNSDVKEGQVILAKIAQINQNKILGTSGGSQDGLALDLELQEECGTLRRVADQLADRLANLNRVAEKMAFLAELESFPSPAKGPGKKRPAPRDLARLSESVSSVCAAYAKQYEYHAQVAEEIGLCRTEDELVFHSCVWLQQPALDDECNLGERYIEYQIENGA